MRAYELMVILSPEVEDRAVEPSLSKFLEIVTNEGGSIENVDIWGRRRLAYEIQKKSELLIAVVQGPNFEGSKEMVKQLTKLCHGLRPAYLMVETMKSLTKILGYNKLLGIPQKYQNKSRFIQSKQYTVDYDAIFGESGGELKDYWELPLEMDRNLDDIPSKKRSMYRKRYAMLDDLAKVIEEKLGL